MNTREPGEMMTDAQDMDNERMVAAGLVCETCNKETTDCFCKENMADAAPKMYALLKRLDDAIFEMDKFDSSILRDWDSLSDAYLEIDEVLREARGES